jgi:hypothetical protein
MSNPIARTRYFAVSQLKTLGPSNKVRGNFLVEFTGVTVGSARVWNKSKKSWSKRIVDLHDFVQCEDYKLATRLDLQKFGYDYTGPIGL